MRTSRFTLTLAALASVLLFASGPGTRLGWWAFPVGFQLLRWATYLGLAAAALSLVAVLVPSLRAGQRARLAIALTLGLAVAAVPLYLLQRARTVPPIHDISTDLDDPPAFVDLVPLRGTGSNPAEYGGAAVAAAQRQAYPDIRPLALELPPARAFAQALAAAEEMGWEVVTQDVEAGRIEAVATTPWFGFKDDVVIRVRSSGPISRVDVRSKSRIGRSDLGTNARRIRSYLETLPR